MTAAAFPFSDDERANRLVSDDPLALLIGFVLDQQVTVQKAFSGPLAIRGRLGTLDPVHVAALDPEMVAARFAEPPAVHRYPRTMAQRVQALCEAVVRDWNGDPRRIWETAPDGEELWRRLRSLPGIGGLKARTLVAIVARRYGVRPPGWEQHVPTWRTLADVTTPDELIDYQTQKRAHKAAMRAAAPKTGTRGAAR